jgi:hypothetical protein
MNKMLRLLMGAICVAMVGASGSARADDADALALESAPELPQKGPDNPLRAYAEVAVGRMAQRYGLPAADTHRLSLDLNWSAKLSDRWRVALSDRLDNIRPAGAGSPSTQNSLREAYASWQGESGQNLVEFGRINLRNGPAYGFNPTDYFRDGALRAVTTADPFALRENRLGTVMLRWQQLWSDGGLSLVAAPRLADAPSNASFSPSFGATNNRNRGLATWSTKFSDRASGQLLALADADRGHQVGASLTGLLSDATVLHFEWSRGRDDDLFNNVVYGAQQKATRNRVSTGLTYATASRLSLTAEYEYNGFAPDRAAWDSAAPAGVALLGRYLLAAQGRQDIASRQAWLLYVSQKSAFWKSLDLTALLRVNAGDRSRLAWVEARYHWSSFDGALQWQSTRGSALSEFGLLPMRQSLQVLGSWYF